MKLDIQFKELEHLVTLMGGTRVNWKSDVIIEIKKPDWQIKLETKGIEFDNINDLKVSSKGLLYYQGQQVLLYIKEAIGDIEYKFHFCDCDALKKMKAKGRWKRYVATQRKDGVFLMDREKVDNSGYERNREEKLLACQNCLKWYNEHYGSYHSQYTKRNFNIIDFFKKFENTPISEKPIYSDITAPAPGYSENWDDISRRTREKYNWICQECGKDFQYLKRLLDVHHINGVKSDNTPLNLKVLCKECHAKHHPHMKK